MPNRVSLFSAYMPIESMLTVLPHSMSDTISEAIASLYPSIDSEPGAVDIVPSSSSIE